MKKIIVLFITLLLLPSVCLAANTATELTTRNIRVYGSGPIHYINVSIDTVDTDLTVYDVSGNDMACVVGMRFSETNAANITFKSGATTMVIPELASNQGTWGNSGLPLCTEAGQDLVIRSNVAISSMLFEVVKAERLQVKP